MKLSLTIISIFLFHFTYSQTFAPDFTMTDTQGNTYHLYNECDQGKTVVLNFFYTTCPSCQHGVPTLDSIWQSYGATGDSVWVWGIEGVIGPTSATNAELDTFRATYGATYPCFSTDFNDDTILYIYGIYGTPQYYVVCPDHQMHHIPIDSIGDYISVCFHITDIRQFQKKHHNLKIRQTGQAVIIDNHYGETGIISIYDLFGKKLYQLNCIGKDSYYIEKSFIGKGIKIVNYTLLSGASVSQKILVE